MPKTVLTRRNENTEKREIMGILTDLDLWREK